MIWVFYITILILLISFIKINLLSFKNQKISQFKSDSKIFDIRKVLEGNLVAEGMVYGISGRLSSTFTAQFSGIGLIMKVVLLRIFNSLLAKTKSGNGI